MLRVAEWQRLGGPGGDFISSLSGQKDLINCLSKFRLQQPCAGSLHHRIYAPVTQVSGSRNKRRTFFFYLFAIRVFGVSGK
jgi:hypothetical protein